MARYQDKDIEHARKLRIKQGYSFAHLQRITGIPATTIRNWCVNDYLGTRWDTLLRTNERRRQELKLSEVSSLNSFEKIDADHAKVLAAIIYGCEGSKYPSTNKLDMTNSDPGLLKVFIKLLRKAFVLNESKFKVHVQIHNTHDFEKVKAFWGNVLNISKKQFIKPTITKPNGGKHRRIYNGTCSIRYGDFRIQLKLIGIYEALLKKLGEVA